MLVLLLSTVLLPPAAASAQTSTQYQEVIPVTTIQRGNPGSEIQLGERNIEDQYVGMTCTVTAVAENQSSVHPNNDLIIRSGMSSVTLENVEREANGLTTANGSLTLSDTATLSLRFGEDGVFSAGITINLVCTMPEPIEVCRDGEIITIDRDERMENDTDVCPQEPTMIEVCRNGEINTIDEDERLETDTDVCPTPTPTPTPQPEQPKQIRVCRDGQFVMINETERKDTDTDRCPAVLAATTSGRGGAATTAPATLAETGTNSIAAVFVATSLIGLVAKLRFAVKF